MEKSTKQEYVAVPTHDIEEAELPAYEETTPVDQSQKRRRRFKFMLIGGALALLGLTHVCSKESFDVAEVIDVSNFQNREPCALRHNEQYAELNAHMDDLLTSFGGPTPFENDRSPPPYPHHGGRFEDRPPHHGDHHRHHPHKGHKGHKHPHHEKPIPPPAEMMDGINEFMSPPFQPEHPKKPHHKKPHHGHPHKPFCEIEKLEAVSTDFKFSPKEFQRAGLFLNGQFSRGGHVRLVKSSDDSVKDVNVKVTLYSGRDELVKEVKLSAFDNKGQYAVQIERGRFGGHRALEHKRPKHHDEEDDDEDSDDEDDNDHDDDERRQEDCLVYNVDIEFPANVDYFEDIELHIKAAQRIQGGKGIEGIEFGTIKAGLGRGAIIFDGLKAKKLLLGVINGVVMGTYQPSENFAASSLRGATKVNIEPTGENINITATSTFGPASVDIPADKYKGDFTLFNLFGETSSIQAPNPEDIHVTKFRHTLKSGYYKEEHTGSRIVVAAKLHGGEYISFN